jgi:cytochrome c553
LNATLTIKHEKNHSNILSIVFATAGLISPLIFAANIAAGKIKFVICYLLLIICGVCIGSNGISMLTMNPNLARQKEQYLVLQMKAFSEADRKIL